MTSDTARSALVALLFVVAACSSSGRLAVEDEPSESGSTPEASNRIRPDGAALTVEVSRVADGDSFRAVGEGRELEVRLIGVNAPESEECLGDEARKRLEVLLAGSPVELRPWPADTDEFGRTLSLVMSGDVFVNLALLESGHAVARDQSDHPHAGEFEAAESTAADAGLGLWAGDACGSTAAGDIEIVDLMANAPGDDRQNPNGEYVVIENAGEDDVDLEGWAIRDESTRHRFSFPRLILEPGQRARLRSGCGENDVGADPVELFWCDPEPPIWNNGGDTAFLLDSAGNTVDFLRS